MEREMDNREYRMDRRIRMVGRKDGQKDRGKEDG